MSDPTAEAFALREAAHQARWNVRNREGGTAGDLDYQRHWTATAVWLEKRARAIENGEQPDRGYQPDEPDPVPATPTADNGRPIYAGGTVGPVPHIQSGSSAWWQREYGTVCDLLTEARAEVERLRATQDRWRLALNLAQNGLAAARPLLSNDGESQLRMQALIDRVRSLRVAPVPVRPKVCGLCGHEMTLDQCGHASVGGVPLCHHDTHSCYHRWTVYGDRPVSDQPEPPIRPSTITDAYGNRWPAVEAGPAAEQREFCRVCAQGPDGPEHGGGRRSVHEYDGVPLRHPDTQPAPVAHPDLIDGDGDRWTWDTVLGGYTIGDRYTGWTRAEIERRWPPVVEAGPAAGQPVQPAPDPGWGGPCGVCGSGQDEACAPHCDWARDLAAQERDRVAREARPLRPGAAGFVLAPAPVESAGAGESGQCEAMLVSERGKYLFECTRLGGHEGPHADMSTRWFTSPPKYPGAEPILYGLPDPARPNRFIAPDRVVSDPGREREGGAALLRLAAAGRREYTEGLKGSDNPSLIEQNQTLEFQAAMLDQAAAVVDGDLGPLFNWLPSWRWTDEMEAQVGRDHQRNRSAARSLPDVPMPPDQTEIEEKS